MPSYPIEPEKLLETADRLMVARRGRPAYHDHRRAVSTAYYAVYHSLTDRVAKAAFGDADDEFLQRVRRWIGHADIRNVAKWIGQLGGTISKQPPAHIAALLKPPGTSHIDSDTLFVAEGFLELNERREQADYDHTAVFTRADSLNQVALARAIVARVESTQSGEAKRFFGLIAMQAKIQPR